MEKFKTTLEAVIWFLAAVFLIWGGLLTGWTYLVLAIGAVAFCIYLDNMDKPKYDRKENSFLIGILLLCNGVFLSLFGAVSGALATFILIMSALGIAKKNLGIAILNLTSMLGFGLLLYFMLGTNYDDAKKSCQDLQKQVKETKLSNAEKDELLKNPFAMCPVLEMKISAKDTDSQKYQQEGDSTFKQLEQIKSANFPEVIAKYKGKSETLRIKRIWMNGEALPWTYSAWKSVNYNVNLHAEIYGSRWIGSRSASITGNITPDERGNASYIGNNDLNYVNIVLSDNTYLRYLIKDNPEWLLVREGESVKRLYVEQKPDLSLNNIFFKEDFDILFTTKYVPLFK